MPIILFDIDYTLFDTNLFKETQLTTFRLYDEVEETLKTLKKNFRLGIFSEGDLEFQETKLKKTAIAAYFEPKFSFIVSDKRDALKELGEKLSGEEQIFMVDDKLEILADIKHAISKVKTVWVKRGFYAEHAKPIPGFAPDFSVMTIGDLPDLFVN